MPQLVELAYFTDDVSRMATFYEHLLGAAPVARSADMAIFVAGGTKLFIHKTYTPGPTDLPPENHVALGVPDLAAACQALESLGLQIEIGPKTYYWGKSAYLRDPDGHLLELIEVTGGDSVSGG